MSAFDPKRTWCGPPSNLPTRAVRWCVVSLGVAVRRREFIKRLGGAVVAWPLAALAQERVRRIGALMTTSLSDPETQARTKAFLQGMQELGWVEGRNIRFDIRWDTSTVDGVQSGRRAACAFAGPHFGVGHYELGSLKDHSAHPSRFRDSARSGGCRICR